MVTTFCMRIASRFTWDLECDDSDHQQFMSNLQVDDFSFITEETYSKAEIIAFERIVLLTLDFELNLPTMRLFLSRFLKAALADIPPSMHDGRHVFTLIFLDHIFQNSQIFHWIVWKLQNSTRRGLNTVISSGSASKAQNFHLHRLEFDCAWDCPFTAKSHFPCYLFYLVMPYNTQQSCSFSISIMTLNLSLCLTRLETTHLRFVKNCSQYITWTQMD